jgi:hypothetical protein
MGTIRLPQNLYCDLFCFHAGGLVFVPAQADYSLLEKIVVFVYNNHEESQAAA